MKRLFKKIARSLWRISAPISRPVIRKFDHHMAQLIVSLLPRNDMPATIELALRSNVRELARIQTQIEILQQQIEDLRATEREGSRSKSRFSVVGEIG
jgi:hypothetical protein